MADGQRGEGESERRGDGEGNELGRLKPGEISPDDGG